MTRLWRVRTGTTLRDRPLGDFGLVAFAEPDESADPVLIRTSALLFRWGRDEDAEAACDYAVSQGLPDTREVDRT